jgi:hypothetical protein
MKNHLIALAFALFVGAGTLLVGAPHEAPGVPNGLALKEAQAHQRPYCNHGSVRYITGEHFTTFRHVYHYWEPPPYSRHIHVTESRHDGGSWSRYKHYC